MFCDLGTPNGKGWNAYEELRSLLADRGVPAERVRFMHEAKTDREKGEIFAAARSGQISVLIGSTERMGVGTNVQHRAVALHHIDCPWRPADIAQRDGRILRQRNLNPEVEILRYVTEGSFDGYLWQTVERKARFIGQVMRGRLDVREMEDIGDVALSYAEVKALASGDPRVLEKARVDSDTNRLERLERSWSRNNRILTGTISAAEKKLPILTTDLERLDAALARRHDTRGDAFTMTVGTYRYDTRPDAAHALGNALLPLQPIYGNVEPRVVAHIGGFDVIAAGQRILEPQVRLELAGVPRSGFNLTLDEVRTDKPLGIITKLENRVAGISHTRVEVERDIERTSSERDRAAAEVGQPFTHADALTRSRSRGQQLAAEMAEDATGPREPEPTPAAAASTRAQPMAQPRPATVTVTADPEATAPPVSPPHSEAPPEQRWRDHALALPDGQRVVDDPGWPGLAATIDRAHRANHDVAEALPRLAAPPLGARRPAAELQYRLLTDCAAAATPMPAHAYQPADPQARPHQPPALDAAVKREPPRW